jgi:hypothetical protein
LRARLLLGLAALACIANAEPVKAPPEAVPVEAVGVYDGSSFETYMAMQLRADGTFEWVLAVGGLDLRSQGEWRERDGEIHFTTLPTPVSAEFRLLGLEPQTVSLKQIVQVRATLPDGRPFTNADVTIECANGTLISDFLAGSTAYFEDYQAPECDRPVAVRVRQSAYDVKSPRYVLAEIGWQPEQALHLEFVPNDIGVYDLTGMHGRLADGILAIDGPLGPAKFRKVPGAQALSE